MEMVSSVLHRGGDLHRRRVSHTEMIFAFFTVAASFRRWCVGSELYVAVAATSVATDVFLHRCGGLHWKW